MTRRTVQQFLLAAVAVLSLGSMAEAAGPKKVVHHRPKHSTRVASGESTAKKRAAQAAKSRSAAKKSTPARRKPTTKPR